MADFVNTPIETLEQLDKQTLISVIRSLQESQQKTNQQLQNLCDQIALINQRTFGRKTEAVSQIDGQMSLSDFSSQEIFNEPEALRDDSKEPEIEEVVISSYTRKKKTKREDILEGLPARILEHKIDEKELSELFPDGYKELPVETYKRLQIIPQTFFVDEHHIHVYASKNNDGKIVRAQRPADVFRNSIATPSLIATIMTGKYLNHFPLDRQSTCYKSYGVKLETNTMANWMIEATEKYLSKIYYELKKNLIELHVVHADESPFSIIKDGRNAGSNSYMWVYRNGKYSDDKPVILYDYQATRKTEHPAEFLKDFSGVLVTDGYQVYHTLEKHRADLTVAGCWVHAKRKLSEIVKALDSKKPDAIIAGKGVKLISEIFHLDNELDDLTKTERKKQRRLVVKPKVDAYFAWAKDAISKVPAASATAKALQYSINQEPFLRTFLNDANVPMDNNRAEQAIRPFTIGRKNWVQMFSKDGAKASAIIYSLVETAKANNILVCEYIEYLLTELSSHSGEPDSKFLAKLMPWSKEVKKACSQRKNLNLPF